jgi:hypothetical protein
LRLGFARRRAGEAACPGSEAFRSRVSGPDDQPEAVTGLPLALVSKGMTSCARQETSPAGHKRFQGILCYGAVREGRASDQALSAAIVARRGCACCSGSASAARSLSVPGPRLMVRSGPFRLFLWRGEAAPFRAAFQRSSSPGAIQTASRRAASSKA